MSTSTPSQRLRGRQKNCKAPSISPPEIAHYDTRDINVFIPIEMRLMTLQALVSDNKLPLSDLHCIDRQSHQLLTILLLNSLKS